MNKQNQIKNGSKSKKASVGIYTIGYQNFKIDEFVGLLSDKGIKVVLDVRNKPFSYKYGFSKYWLEKYLPESNIQYINIPDLGIPAKFRNELTGNRLWKKYKEILNYNLNFVEEAIQIIQNNPTALMCFEADPDSCHRSILSQIIHDKTNLKIFHYIQENNEWILKEF